jgi:signal peptidase I
MTTDSSLNPAPDASSANAAPSSSSKPVPHEGGVKETLESILIAFILAFIFRAFVVEAFVIPTGSMAPTLLGANIRFTCTDCGYHFEANFSPTTDSGGSDVYIPPVADGATFGAHCPNCGLKVPKVLSPAAPAGAPYSADDDDDDPRRGDPDNDATAPPVHYGDRILVLKYVYELFEPQRWDVVVFKTPDPNSTPLYTVNYIKRLIGRPNESVMILDGDIYVKSAGSDQWIVQTKPRVAQSALWRIVYDNDFLPHRPDFVQPWQPADPAGGWLVGTPTNRKRELTFDRPDSRGTAWLTFSPDPKQANQPLKDWLAYADTREQRGGNSPRRTLVAENYVSDLKLQFFYERKSGTGPLRLELSKIDQTFTAEIEPDRVRLLRRVGSETEELFPFVPLEPKSGPLRVEFANADYQVTLRINGKDYFRTTPQQYAPDIALLRRHFDNGAPLPPPQVRIGAEAQSCTLSHVSLWRDVYYTNSDPRGGGWNPKYGTPDKPIVLGPKEYWVLGDNSLMSGDARFWDAQIRLPHESLMVDAARVPERFLIGKAFFVYWPAGYRLTTGGPGFIPNFGEMRFIH